MTDKLVHVNAYTRDDGTPVREHYRGSGRSYNSLLKLSLSSMLDEGLLIAEKLLPAFANINKSLASQGLKIKEMLMKGYSSEELCLPMEQMCDAYEKSKQIEAQLLEKLVNAKNQREYSPLYEAYIKQRDMNKVTQNTLPKLDYAIQNKDYDLIVSAIDEYNRAQQEKIAEKSNRTLQKESKPDEKQTKDFDDFVLRNVVPFSHNKPYVEKEFINLGFEILFRNAYDAKNLWNLSVSDNPESELYLQQNGSMVDSISELPLDLQERVRDKVRQQLHVEDSWGIVLNPSSSLSLEVAQSPEFQNKMKKHISELLRGEIVSDSANFTSNKNLRLSLGNADILDAYINSNGAIVAFILDTYDFNKADGRGPVELAYDVQIHGLLSNYFSISIIVVPKEEWLRWFI